MLRDRARLGDAPGPRQYQDFVARYSQYWRRFFDPIAIRVQVTPEQYRVETIILPLIDNSLYGSGARSWAASPSRSTPCLFPTATFSA